jgi:hypothetical protein
MSSGSPPKGDIAQYGRHFAFVPNPEVATLLFTTGRMAFLN